MHRSAQQWSGLFHMPAGMLLNGGFSNTAKSPLDGNVLPSVNSFHIKLVNTGIDYSIGLCIDQTGGQYLHWSVHVYSLINKGWQSWAKFRLISTIQPGNCSRKCCCTNAN